MDIGPAELVIVLLIVLLLFGGAKLPSLARSMGQAAKEFRSGLAEGTSDDDKKDSTPDDKKDSTPGGAEKA